MEKFGSWTVVRRDTHPGKPRWICVCDCGNERSVLQTSLRSGMSQSCGCSRGWVLTMIGSKHGKLTVLNCARRDARRDYFWTCLCECGTTAIINGTMLRTGKTKSCGRCQRERASESKITHAAKSMIGRKNNKLTVIGLSPQKAVGRQFQWVCRCDCGTLCVVRGASFRSGATKSCGCYRLERVREAATRHGCTAGRTNNDRTYRSWRAMRGRCLNPKNVNWHNYGGRGISICKRWDDYSLFLADMGIRPAGKSIDRIDNSKNYSPDNCRWATPAEQSRNSRKTKLTEDIARSIRSDRSGGTLIKDIAAARGVSQTTIWSVTAGQTWREDR